jgi:hypothetical protein
MLQWERGVFFKSYHLLALLENKMCPSGPTFIDIIVYMILRSLSSDLSIIHDTRKDMARNFNLTAAFGAFPSTLVHAIRVSALVA